MSMATETIELPKELDDAIQSAAERTGKAKHDLMLEALRRRFVLPAQDTSTGDEPRPDLEGRGSPREWRVEDLESLGIAEDTELSGADVKDWLRANWRPL